MISGGFRCKEQEVVGKDHCAYTRTLHPNTRLSLLSSPSKPFTPSNYHTVYCAFCSEILEASLLVEFHQIKGLVAEQRLTQGHLLGVRRDTSPAGITQLVSRQPTTLLRAPQGGFCYSQVPKKWVEAASSRLFSPKRCGPWGSLETVGLLPRASP